MSSENHFIRFLKGLYPISELVRAFDLHFSSQDTILRRLSELEAVRNEIREVRDRLTALESNPALLSEISGRLASIEGPVSELTRVDAIKDRSAKALPPATVVVTPNEVNSCHGTGILVKRLFGSVPSVVSLRTTDTYTGGQEFGYVQHKLPQRGLSRYQIFLWVSRLLGGLPVKRVVCVPYYPDDLLVALAVKEVFNVPMCLYIMDDQNLVRQNIPDSLMAEAVNKSALRLAISAEMEWAYQNKYQQRFWLLPPLVPADLIREKHVAAGEGETKSKGILIGNIWSQRWLDGLRRTLPGANVQIDWYCNQRSSGGLEFDDGELAGKGVRYCKPLPEAELADIAPEYQFALMPTSAGEDEDTADPISLYSLPSRVPFVIACTQLPILVVGRADSCVARFVERYGVGTSCAYEPASFAEAVTRLADPDTQESLRANARRIAPIFSDSNMPEWILRSIDRGEPVDQRFEEFAPPEPGTFLCYCETASPPGVIAGLVPIYQALRRLKRLGFLPDYVVDIGASTGIWSYTIAAIFPDARYLLVDALAARYRHQRASVPGNVTWIESAVADHVGKTSLKVSDDLYNSSLVHVSDAAKEVETVEVPVTTLDQLAAEYRLEGRGLVKIDVQYVEDLVIEGATSTLADSASVVVIELTLDSVDGRSKTLHEMLDVMRDRGFVYWDDGGEWRDRVTGVLEQKDLVFVRKELFTKEA